MLSISKVADAGCECHLNQAGILLDAYTGERVPIQRKRELVHGEGLD